MKLEDSRVIVTGASSGIGSALAAALAGEGARLVLTGRREDRLCRLESEIAASCPTVPPPLCHPCDLTDIRAIERLVAASVEALGGVDILINNAGISAYGASDRATAADIENLFAVNLRGPCHMIRHVLPHMRREGSGLIVNVTSVAAIYGVPFLGAYAATKAGLVAFSQSLRAELAGSGIGVLIVYPGYTSTDIFRRERKLGGATRPPGPYRKPERVARGIVRAIRRDRQNHMPSEGRVLRLAGALSPGITGRVFHRLARQLRSDNEARHA